MAVTRIISIFIIFKFAVFVFVFLIESLPLSLVSLLIQINSPSNLPPLTLLPQPSLPDSNKIHPPCPSGLYRKCLVDVLIPPNRLVVANSHFFTGLDNLL